jgi:hypothetical protein
MHRFNREHSFPGLLSESYTLRHLRHIGYQRTAKLSNVDQSFNKVRDHNSKSNMSDYNHRLRPGINSNTGYRYANSSKHSRSDPSGMGKNRCTAKHIVPDIVSVSRPSRHWELGEPRSSGSTSLSSA